MNFVILVILPRDAVTKRRSAVYHIVYRGIIIPYKWRDFLRISGYIVEDTEQDILTVER